MPKNEIIHYNEILQKNTMTKTNKDIERGMKRNNFMRNAVTCMSLAFVGGLFSENIPEIVTGPATLFLSLVYGRSVLSTHKLMHEQLEQIEKLKHIKIENKETENLPFTPYTLV